MGMIIPSATYLKAQRLRRQFRADMGEMASKVDVVMTPATPAPAPKDLNTTGDAAFQVPWTAAGLPTVVVPTGLSDLGMPMAVQFGGPWAEEGRVLGAAQWCERVAGLNQGPPNYS
jgi:Asp-tRNA(Asn)/Glu-tRNA(Gln) amidotransferase A subunit family amidase